jgi:hypothetical protein
VAHKLYLTGGIGATGHGEAFGAPYHLPNMSAYAETCASIANVYWNSRMFLMNGDAQYIDVMERILYNGLLSGVSLGGDRFFYPNPLASMGQHQRSAWFSCACCISNMTRFMPSVPGYVYAQKDNSIYVNLYVANKADIKLPAGNMSLEQQTEYPWKGNVKLVVTKPVSKQVTMMLRVPGWARQEAVPSSLYQFLDQQKKPVTVKLNGKPVKYTVEKGYMVLSRLWKKGDRIEMELPMEIEKVVANEKVKDDQQRFASQRGPLVYCLEGADNLDSAVQNIVVEKTEAFTAGFEPSLLNGVMVLQAKGTSTRRQLNSEALVRSTQTVKAIPYYSWNNRGASEMEVWIPYNESVARPKPAPTLASRSTVTSSQRNQRMLRGINDQYEPKDSQDNNSVYLHWWPKKNTLEWIQYDFPQASTVNESKVYWFDDGPFGGCRIPKSWRILYQQDGEWKPVEPVGNYEVSKDAYNTIQFRPVTTTALRLEIQLPEEHAAGIHEWIVK